MCALRFIQPTIEDAIYIPSPIIYFEKHPIQNVTCVSNPNIRNQCKPSTQTSKVWILVTVYQLKNSTVVEKQPTEQAMVAMHNQASNRHRVEALPLKSLSYLA
jgi:hypothetical protein